MPLPGERALQLGPHGVPAVSEQPDYHIQISDRGGAVIVSGPDPAWVAEQARWAVANRTDPRSPMGFSIESGGTSQTERADPNGPDGYYLGEGGPKL